MITDLKLIFDINIYENAFLINSPGGSTKNVPVYVPKLMSTMGKPENAEKSKKPIDPVNKIFINDADCRPSLNSVVTTRNYLTADMENGGEWTDSSKRITCVFPNGSLKKIYFNTSIS